MTEQELKSVLFQIQEGKKSLEEINVSELIDTMIQYIGATDSALRDELIYETFCEIFMSNYLENTELHQLVVRVLDENLLLNGIGLVEDDSVFTRAFSVLLLAPLFSIDNELNFLSVEEVDRVKEVLLIYMKEEQDLRGYVENKGWARSVAHCTDAIESLVKNKKLSKNEYPRIMDILLQKVRTTEHTYVDDEDERLLIPIVAMMEKGYPSSNLIAFMNGIPDMLEQSKSTLASKNYFILYTNLKLFMRSVYFRFKENQEYSDVVECAESNLKEISYYY